MPIKSKLLLIISLVSLILPAQQKAFRSYSFNKHTTYLGSESVNPFIINQLQIPLNSNIKASFSIILKSNSGNTMIHETTLKNKNGGFIKIEYDAVIEKNAVYFSYPLHEKLELFMEVSFNYASKKGMYNPMNWVVQDAFIENFHEFSGKSDPFKRKEKGLNKFVYSSVDKNKNSLSIEENSIFIIPLLTGINYYITLFKDDTKIISGNSTFSLKSDPLQKTVETGFGLSINRSKKIGKNKSFTLSGHGSIYYHNLLNNNENIFLIKT